MDEWKLGVPFNSGGRSPFFLMVILFDLNFDKSIYNSIDQKCVRQYV